MPETELYSPAEAAYIVGRPVKAVQKAIDEGGIASRRVRQGGAVVRRIGEPELVYLRPLKDVSGALLPAAKRRLYRELREQRTIDSAVRIGPVTVNIAEARREVAARAEELRKARARVVHPGDPRRRAGGARDAYPCSHAPGAGQARGARGGTP